MDVRREDIPCEGLGHLQALGAHELLDPQFGCIFTRDPFGLMSVGCLAMPPPQRLTAVAMAFSANSLNLLHSRPTTSWLKSSYYG